MVSDTVRLLGNRRGKSRLGCLIWLLVLSMAVYYGWGIGQHYLAYYQMLDEMQVQARVAKDLDDNVIHRRLSLKAEELDLPAEARLVVIRRLERPREVVITTSWQVFLEVPFYTRRVTFRPTARERL
jgi:hypothetical protein